MSAQLHRQPKTNISYAPAKITSNPQKQTEGLAEVTRPATGAYYP
jgi:hypothetical protein